MINSFDVVFYTTIFIMPGFLIRNIIDTLNPPRKLTDSVLTLNYLGYSIINCACLSWIYKIILSLKNTHPVLFWLLFLSITLVGALLIGFIIAIFKQTNVIDRVWSKFNVKSIHPTPTAWDYVFSQQKASYVIVTLEDGTEIRGLYSFHSFCSSDNENRDLFLEKTYKIGNNDEWIYSPDSNGIYIPSAKIKYIEFKEGSQNGQ